MNWVLSVLIFSFAVGIKPAHAESAAQSLFWDLKIAGPNACARDSSKPAQSVFVFADGITLGRAIAKLSQNSKSDPSFDVKAAWTELHRSLNFTFNIVMHGLVSGALPYVNNAEEAERIQFAFHGQDLTSDKVRCVLVKKALPAQFKTLKIEKQDLEDYALAYLDAENYVDECESVDRNQSTKPELVLRFDIAKVKKDISFEFWHSFKIYSANFWKRGLFKQKAPQYSTWLQSFPLEEMTLLIPEGCGSLSRPECRSDFLSQSQITNLVKMKDFDKGPLMVKDLARQQIERAQNQTQVQSTYDSNKLVQNLSPQSFLQDITKIRHQAALQLFDSQMNLTAIFHQKSPEQLAFDIEKFAADNSQEALDQLESACVENIMVSNVDLSGLAKEISSNRKLIAALDKAQFPGELASVSLQKVFKLSELLAPVCEKYKMRFLDGTGAAGSRPWVRQYYSTLVAPEMIDTLIHASNSPSGVYLSQARETLCATAIDCWRTVIESTVRLYQISVQSSVVMNPNQVLDSDLGRGMGATVACKLYDPWAETNKRYQKLLLDTVSAVVSGITRIPIYLNLTPSLPRVASFAQLMESDSVRLDPVYWSNSWKRTLLIDLGQLANAPCMISISNESQIKTPNSSIVFKGVSVNACSKNQTYITKQNSTNLTAAESSQSNYCGQCSLDFETVATTVVQSQFSYFRAGLRLLQGFIEFFRASENPMLSPIENIVRPKYVAATYEKYKTIPDQCVFELTNGAPCMEDLCVSRTVSDFERRYDLKVTGASRFSDSDNQTDRPVWVKIEGCEKEVRIPVNCQDNHLPSYIGWGGVRIPKECRGKE